MRHLIRQILISLLGCILVHAMCLLLLLPRAQERNLDTDLAEMNFSVQSLQYYSGADLVARSGYRFQHARKPLLMLFGASNMHLALHPQELQPYFPQYEVCQLGLDQAYIRETLEEIRFITQHCNPSILKQSVFVLGICPYQFRNNFPFYQNNHSRLAQAILQTGMYRDTASFTPQMSPAYAAGVIEYLQPFYSAYACSRWTKWWLENMPGIVTKGIDQRTFAPMQQYFSSPIRTPYTPVSDSQRHDTRWIDSQIEVKTDDTIQLSRYFNHDQFRALLDVARLIDEHHARLVIVDMPIRPFVRARDHVIRAYNTAKQPYLDQVRVKYPVRYINIMDVARENDFDIFSHPNPLTTAHWSRYLAEAWYQQKTAQ